ncbi:MAG: response regulator [Deltaproteobacteria bacterium]|nr:response regulator [Deltaproteobacteria bacterium]
MKIKSKLFLIVVSASLLTGASITLGFSFLTLRQSKLENHNRFKVATQALMEHIETLGSTLDAAYLAFHDDMKVNANMYFITTGALLDYQMLPEIRALGTALGLERFAFYSPEKPGGKELLQLYYSRHLRGNVLVAKGKHKLYVKGGFGSTVIPDFAIFSEQLPQEQKDVLLVRDGKLLFQAWRPFRNLSARPDMPHGTRMGTFCLQRPVSFDMAKLGRQMSVEFAVYDEAGHVIKSTMDAQDLKQLPGKKRQRSALFDKHGRAFDSLLLPIVYRTKRVGYLSANISVQAVRDNIAGAIMLMSIISASVIIMVLLMSERLVSRFIAPILKLTHVSKEMAGGNLEQELRISSQDELGLLARNFVKMRDAIGVQISKLNEEITERKRTEEALRREKENLRITLSSIGDAVIATHTDATIIRMNPVAETLTGWSFEDAQGKPLTEVFQIVHKHSRKPAENPVEKVIATGEIIGLATHAVLISRDGSEYQITNSGAPIRSDTDETLGVVLVFRDVTNEAAIQEQLWHSQKMDAIGQLAGGVAHDFNNMLGGIIGASELLGARLPKDPEAQDLHNIIMDSARRAADLTEKLLTFARRKPSASSTIDLHRTIHDTVALLETTIDRRVQIEVDAAAEENLVVGDPSRIQNALLNLGINASHAMPEGGVLRISTQVVELDASYCEASTFDLKPGPHLKIEVRDTGRGIAAKDLARIFEPFYTTKEQGKGTGLGLAAVFGTVQQHGGAITVYSELGTGTSFQLLLPLTKGEAIAQPASPQTIRGSGRILVVDDEPAMRITAEAILVGLGYDVLLAEDGKEGVKIFDENPGAIDLVLLDMIMPVMNGRDCFAAIRKTKPDARVVLSSGFSREEDIQEMMAMGLNAFIRKPFRGAALSQVVHDVLTS